MKENQSKGRPSGFTEEIAEKICERIAEGESLRSICADEELPSSSMVFRWLRNRPGFREQYARACTERIEAMAEDVLEYSDKSVDAAYNSDPKAASAVVQAHKLQVDTRKWIMSKLAPKKYGDKFDVTSDGKALPTPIIPIEPQQK